jgi:hypothetical protein
VWQLHYLPLRKTWCKSWPTGVSLACAYIHFPQRCGPNATKATDHHRCQTFGHYVIEWNAGKNDRKACWRVGGATMQGAPAVDGMAVSPTPRTCTHRPPCVWVGVPRDVPLSELPVGERAWSAAGVRRALRRQVA